MAGSAQIAVFNDPWSYQATSLSNTSFDPATGNLECTAVAGSDFMIQYNSDSIFQSIQISILDELGNPRSDPPPITCTADSTLPSTISSDGYSMTVHSVSAPQINCTTTISSDPLAPSSCTFGIVFTDTSGSQSPDPQVTDERDPELVALRTKGSGGPFRLRLGMKLKELLSNGGE